MKVALICVAKDEHYIKEWIEYHRKLGFDRIFIYENNWRCLATYDYVEKIPFDEPLAQFKAYNDWFSSRQTGFDWVAVIDCDEFIVLKKHKTIQEFLSAHMSHPILALNWQLYGAGGRLNRSGDSVLKTYTKRQKGVNPHVKVICRLPMHCTWCHPHYVVGQQSVDPAGNKFDGPFNHKGQDTEAIINHYYLKSLEDYRIKCHRGCADITRNRNPEEWHAVKNDNCEVEDLTACRFLYPV